MKVIIAGSRAISTDLDWHVIQAVTESPFAGSITEIVSGGAAGPDLSGERWATEWHVPVKRFVAEWRKYGRGAGFVRNQQMGWYADALIAVWDGKSSGTSHMVQFMQRLKKPVYVYTVPDGDRKVTKDG